MWLRLPDSGVLLDTDLVAWVGRKEVNQYLVFFKSDLPHNAMISGKDLDVLMDRLGAEKPSLPSEVVVSK